MLEKKMKGRVTKLAKEIVTRWKRIATQYESPVQVVEAVNDNDDHQPTSDVAEEVKEELEEDAKAEASNIYTSQPVQIWLNTSLMRNLH